MFWCKRALVCVWLLAAVPACAFTFSYGSLFEVKDVKNTGGALVLPLTRGKYKNVKVLSKEVYDFLLKCSVDCRYGGAGAAFEVRDFRKALTRERMLIADIAFNQEIILTFLVFKNKDGFSVKAPQEAVFKDRKLYRQVRQKLTQVAEETL